MEAAVRTTTGSRRRKGHGRDYPRQPSLVGGEYLESLGSGQQMPSDNPTTDELRRVRTEFYRKSPEDRRREAERDMNSHTTQSRHSRSRRSSIKLPESSIRDLRRDPESKHRHRREKYTEEPEDDTVYVYKQVYENPKDADHAKPMSRRRASAPRATTRYDAEGVRAQEPSITRRHTERRASARREAGVELNRSRRRSDSDAAVPSSLMSRSASLREKSSRLDSRPPLARSHTTVHKAQPSLQSNPTLPTIKDKTERKVPSARKVERPVSIFGTLFGMQKPQEATPERQVECLTCLSSDIPISKSAKLACKHRMCHACLRRIFTMSVTDPQHMPPKCCTQDHIPLKHVEKLFDTRFKIKWNQKYQEYTTKNRVYCPAKGCGEWIKPSQIHLDTSGGANTGRKYGKCGRCRTKVCCTCNGKWHTSRECPKDEATKQFAEVAKKEGWKKCFNCSAMVELNEGCNHMTCRCRAEFCMSCGLKWKTCDCPWFTYQAVENDRLRHMNAPGPGWYPPGRPGGRLDPAFRLQEAYDRRREQEQQRDDILARRMQILGLNGADNNNDFPLRPMRRPPRLNEDFVHRAADMISGAAMHAMATARNGNTPDRPALNVIPPPPVPQQPLRNAHAVHLPRQQPPLRHHSAASRRYNNHASTRPSERVVPGRAVADYELEAQSHRPEAATTTAAAPIVGAAGGRGGEAPGPTRPGQRHSVMAGLTGGSGEGRVDEWRRHIGEE